MWISNSHLPVLNSEIHTNAHPMMENGAGAAKSMDENETQRADRGGLFRDALRMLYEWARRGKRAKIL